MAGSLMNTSSPFKAGNNVRPETYMDFVLDPRRHQSVTPYKEVTGLIVPFWIQKALNRHKFNYIDILDYAKVRSVLTTEDIATWAAANNHKAHPVLDKMRNDGSFYWAFFGNKQVPQALQDEYYSIIEPLSHSEPIKKLAFERMCQENQQDILFNMQEDSDASSLRDLEKGLYEFKIVNEQTFFMFTYQGLFNALDNRDYVKTLVSNYLKTLYSLLTIAEVSATPAHELYVSLL